eukprot:2769542-Prymnesium_polylepis.1
MISPTGIQTGVRDRKMYDFAVILRNHGDPRSPQLRVMDGRGAGRRYGPGDPRKGQGDISGALAPIPP